MSMKLPEENMIILSGWFRIQPRWKQPSIRWQVDHRYTDHVKSVKLIMSTDTLLLYFEHTLIYTSALLTVDNISNWGSTVVLFKYSYSNIHATLLQITGAFFIDNVPVDYFGWTFQFLSLYTTLFSCNAGFGRFVIVIVTWLVTHVYAKSFTVMWRIVSTRQDKNTCHWR